MPKHSTGGSCLPEYSNGRRLLGFCLSDKIVEVKSLDKSLIEVETDPALSAKMSVQLKVNGPRGEEKIVDICDNMDQMKALTVMELKSKIAKALVISKHDFSYRLLLHFYRNANVILLLNSRFCLQNSLFKCSASAVSIYVVFSQSDNTHNNHKHDF